MMKQENKEKNLIAKADIPSPLKLQFKILCARKGLNMSVISEHLLRNWLIAGEPTVSKMVSFPEEDLEVISVYIPESLKVQLKVKCMEEKVTMKFVLFQLIQIWVAENSEHSSSPVKVLSANRTV
ncbi:MAG: hypothetical protein AAFQ80_07005 [Cyanobacteria bacterium J06621_8]